MLSGIKAVRKQLGEGVAIVAAVFSGHIDPEITCTEFPHHLAAHTAGRESTGDVAILATADSNSGKIPAAFRNRFENSCPLSTVGWAVGSVFNVAAGIYLPVGAKKGSTHMVAGLGGIGVGHSLHGQFNQFFRSHRKSPLFT